MKTEVTVNAMDEATRARSARLWRDSIIIDGLAGEALDWQRQIEAGITATNVTVSVTNAAFAFDDMLRNMDPYLMMLSLVPDEVMLVLCVADIREAKANGKFGLIFGLQNGAPLGEDPRYVRAVHRLGVRVIQLTYNERNALGDGCLEPENRGLTAFGQQVVREMNRLGILIDLSHVGDRTCAEAIELSSDPCIFSHANPRSLAKNPRNKPDSLLRAIAERGGIVGLTPYSAFTEIEPGVRPTFDEFFRLVDYTVQLVGIDHVAFGSDGIKEHREPLGFEILMGKRYPPELAKGYTPETRHVKGFERLEGWIHFVDMMLARGYSDDDVRRFIGGNLLRVFEQVWG